MVVVRPEQRAEAQPVVQAYAAKKPAVAATSVPAPAASVAVDSNVIQLTDDAGNRVKPSAVLTAFGDLYCLSPLSLWKAPGFACRLGHASEALLERIDPPKTIDGIRFQELNNFALCPDRKSLIVLDKSGDLFEYLPGSKKWQVFRANLPFFNGQPDPAFIDFCPQGTQMLLLDPERSEIWRTKGRSAKMDPLFRVTTTPWILVPGRQSVRDGLGIAFDSGIYVLKKNGLLTKYNGTNFRQEPFHYQHLGNERPTRLLTAPGLPLFIVERENDRVLTIDKKTGHLAQFVFPSGSDLRGLMPTSEGFWIANSGALNYRKFSAPDSMKTPIHKHAIDERLRGMLIPVKGVALPNHVGVFPGARRLYRFGIHEGMDFFNGGGAANPTVQMGTPARATKAGKVIRADADFVDMNAKTFSKVMSECFTSHRTSDHNEDLLRGCQVWIDHGGGMVTRYAHLSRINPALKKGDQVARGEVIGFIGVSGTGQNLPGRAKYPHLHFETWLDGKYVGWGLTPAETIGEFEDIFGKGSER